VVSHQHYSLKARSGRFLSCLCSVATETCRSCTCVQLEVLQGLINKDIESSIYRTYWAPMLKSFCKSQ